MVAQFKVSVDDEAWRKLMREKAQPLLDASILALRETAANSVFEGRRNIASAGRFGRNWQRDLQFRMIGTGLETKAIVFHKSALATVFESGATIRGRHLLWIPVTPGMPPPRRSGKRLTFARVRGHALLFDADDRDRHRRPLYFGVPVVTIRKKWRITEIVEEQVKKFAALFHKFFRGE
jgi:hypothetical protein